MRLFIEEPDDRQPLPDVAIRITLPEVFVGCAISALNSRQGRISGLEKRDEDTVMIAAVLPGPQYDGLPEEIASLTDRRAVVERTTNV